MISVGTWSMEARARVSGAIRMRFGAVTAPSWIGSKIDGMHVPCLTEILGRASPSGELAALSEVGGGPPKRQVRFSRRLRLSPSYDGHRQLGRAAAHNRLSASANRPRIDLATGYGNGTPWLV